MKRIVSLTLIIVALFITNQVKAQFLPPAYEAILDEIVENFEVIRGTTSLKDGKTSLRMLSEEKLIIRMDHKKMVKTLTFIKKKDEEGNKFWVSANQLTTDMINKYEKDVTKVVEIMLDRSREEAKE